MKTSRAAIAAGLALALSAVAAPVVAQAEPGHPTTFIDAAVRSLRSNQVTPPGANNYRCKSDDKPVILVHGTWENAFNTWSALTPALMAAKRCVFTLNFGKGDDLIGANRGVFGTGPIETSASELARFVQLVQTRTNSPKVDVVAHSQGES